MEAGCFKGGSTAKFSIAAKIAGRRLYVFDSFQGIPAHNEDHGRTIWGGAVAFRQGDYVPGPAKMAGIRAGDVIFDIDGKQVEMTMLRFNAHVRLKYKVGDHITLNVLRDGKRLVIAGRKSRRGPRWLVERRLQPAFEAAPNPLAKRFLGRQSMRIAQPIEPAHTGRDVSDHHRRSSASDTGAVVVLGQPITAIAPTLRMAGEIECVAQRLGSIAALDNRR